MIIHQGIEKLHLQNTIVTLGIFDGVHLAHQSLLSYLREYAAKDNRKSVLITFLPHPRTVIQPYAEPLKLLSTQVEKTKLIEMQGIDHLVIIPFTKDFSEVTALQFINEILVDKLGVRELVLGYDHHFGKNREGNIEFLKNNQSKFAFKVTEIPKLVIKDVAVNSSNIRRMLALGDVKSACELLGRNYSISGIVIKGNQLGRTIGYPTANIMVENDSKLIPANGVYVVELKIENIEQRTKNIELSTNNYELTTNNYKGMLNIGFRPTVDGKKLTIEVNIFDFDEEIYGQELTIYLIAKLRDEQKFDGLEGLKKQLAIDKLASNKVLKIH